MIISKTPYRISLFGGGTDFPEWFNNYGPGLTISTSIDKYSFLRLRELPPFFKHKHRFVYSRIELINNKNQILHPVIRETLKYLNINKGIEIHHNGDLPARSGIGSSSSFSVGLLNVLFKFLNKKIDKKKLAEIAIKIEREILNEKGGWQDQVIVSYGGLRLTKYSNNSFYTRKIKIPKKKILELNDNLIMIYTGSSRYSYNIQKKIVNNSKQNIRLLSEICSLTKDAFNLINNQKNYSDLGNMMHETWLIKKSLNSEISNSHLDEIYKKARKSGALGGKILGAGKAGFMIFFCKKELRKKIIKSLSDYLHIPFKFEETGSEIIS